MKKYSTYLRNIIIVILALVPLTAAYLSPGTFFPYITGKNFAFRILVELALVLYIPLIYADASFRPRKSLGLVVYGAFIAILFAADIFGVNSASSLWSNYERMEGFVTHIHLFVFTLILISLRLKEIEWRRILQTYVFANAIVIYYAIVEYRSFVLAGEGIRRLASTLGNPAYLAIYCAFIIFFVLILWAREKAVSKVVQVLYVVSITANLIVLWATQTRSTIIGILAGAVIGMLWYAWKERSNKKLRIYALSAIIVSVLFVLAFVSFRSSDFIQNNKTLKRLADINLQEQTVRSRVMIWKMSFEGVKERPVLGWGQDNFVYVFAKHYNPEMFDQEQWFDRSHNVFFDWLIAAGFLGLFAYLSLFGAAVFSVIKNKVSRFDTTEQSLILALLTAYFVNNIFVFDNLISYLCFFTLFAYIFSDKHDKDDSGKKAHVLNGDVGMLWIIAGLSAFGVAIVMLITIYEPLAKNKAISEMYRLTQQGSLEDLKAISSDMAIPAVFGNTEANEQILMLSGAVIRSKAGDEDKKYFFELANKQINRDIEEDVLNPRPPVLYASFFASLGLYDKAIPVYQEALKRTPNKTLLWLDLAQVQERSGDRAGATESALRSHELSHRSIQSAIAVATLYSMEGKKAESERVWDETVLANKSSQEVLLKRISFYKGHNEYKSEMAKTVEEFRSLYKDQEASLQSLLSSTTTPVK